MFNQHFYHEKIRKCVAVFGTLFNNIHVVRKNASGAAISQMKVPLSYAPKAKFLERIRETEEMTDTKLAIKLPRMSFEIDAIYFDPTRQLPKVNNFTRLVSDDTGVRTKFFTSVPYIINFELNILSKTNEDAVQILEQIIPFFNPAFTITMKPFSDSKIIRKAIVDFTDQDTNELLERITVEPDPISLNIIGDSDFPTTTRFLYPGEGDSI